MALDTTAAAHPEVHDHEPHVHGGPKLYGAILGALLVLTVITVGASMIDWGGGMANVIIAMLIATLKASLVALFFMHLRWDKPMTGIIFCSTLFFLGLFLIGCYTDQVARPWPEPANLKPPVAKPGAPGSGPTMPGTTAPVGTSPASSAPVTPPAPAAH